jgi:hypothetical protein
VDFGDAHIVRVCLCCCFQRTHELNDLDDSYEAKQADLDGLQAEVVKLEGIVAAISDNVRERTHNTIGMGAVANSSSQQQQHISFNASHSSNSSSTIGFGREEAASSAGFSSPVGRASTHRASAAAPAASISTYESSFVSATPLYGSPANRLAASAASAALVARQLAAEEDRQFSASMRVLSATGASAVKAARAAERSPHAISASSPPPSFGSPRASAASSNVQRALHLQLDDLEQQVAAARRRAL